MPATILSPAALAPLLPVASPYELATLMSSRSLKLLVERGFDPEETGVVLEELPRAAKAVSRLIQGQKKVVFRGTSREFQEGLQKTLDWIEATTVGDDNARQFLWRLGDRLSERIFQLPPARAVYREAADAHLQEIRQRKDSREKGEGVGGSPEKSRRLLEEVYVETIDHLQAAAWNTSLLSVFSVSASVVVDYSAITRTIPLPYAIASIPLFILGVQFFAAAAQNWMELHEAAPEVKRILERRVSSRKKSLKERIFGDPAVIHAIAIASGVVTGGLAAFGFAARFRSASFFDGYSFPRDIFMFFPSIMLGLGTGMKFHSALLKRAKNFLVARGNLFQGEANRSVEASKAVQTVFIDGVFLYIGEHFLLSVFGS